jgi:hypothetical protein
MAWICFHSKAVLFQNFGSNFAQYKSEGGKLSFLNNAVGVFESEIDVAGNFSEKLWEWK